MSFSRRPPRFQPGPGYEQQLARIDMRADVLGGRSKKDQLGSVAESWGPAPGPRQYGLNQIEQDAPSRSTSPFKTIDPIRVEPDLPAPRPNDLPDLLAARFEALKVARKGTAYEVFEGQSRPDRRLVKEEEAKWRLVHGPSASEVATHRSERETRPRHRESPAISTAETSYGGSIFSGSRFAQESGNGARPIYTSIVDNYRPQQEREPKRRDRAKGPTASAERMSIPTSTSTATRMTPSDQHIAAEEQSLPDDDVESVISSIQRAPSSLDTARHPYWTPKERSLAHRPAPTESQPLGRPPGLDRPPVSSSRTSTVRGVEQSSFASRTPSQSIPASGASEHAASFAPASASVMATSEVQHRDFSPPRPDRRSQLEEMTAKLRERPVIIGEDGWPQDDSSFAESAQ